MSLVIPSLDIFKRLTEELSSLLEKEGLAVRPYANEQMLFFRALNEKQQFEIISGLKHFMEAAKRVLRLGSSLKDSELFVKTALTYFAFEPHPDFSKHAFTPNVVVEFYTLSGMQLFRTFNYFEMTSYTLEDIYCRQWIDLYERPAPFIQKMFVDVEALVTSADPQRSFTYGPHTIKERVSLEHLEVYCEGQHIAPLCRGGKVVAISSLVACRPLESAYREIIVPR